MPYNPIVQRHTKSDPARILGLMSGSGSTLTEMLEYCRQHEEVLPFTIPQIVTDRSPRSDTNPQGSNAERIGERYEIPVTTLSWKKFYEGKSIKKPTLGSDEWYTLREQWTKDVVAPEFNKICPDFCSMLGFESLLNILGPHEDCGEYITTNTHPGGLYHLKDDKRRLLVGNQEVPTMIAILNGHDYVQASLILARPYGDDIRNLDNGEILVTSQKLPIQFPADFTQTQIIDRFQERSEDYWWGNEFPLESDDELFWKRFRKFAGEVQEGLKDVGDKVIIKVGTTLLAQGRFGIWDHPSNQDRTHKLCLYSAGGSRISSELGYKGLDLEAHPDIIDEVVLKY